MMRAKPAEQERSRAKRDLLLQVTEDLLRERPFHQLSVAEVAAAAGVSVATVYQRFNNRHAMGSILLELYFTRTRQWWADPSPAPFPASLREALVLLADKAWEQINQLQHIMRPAYLFSRNYPELVGDEWQAMEQHAQQGFEDFLQQFSTELQSKNVKKIASALCYFYNFMAVGKLLHGDETHWPLLKNKKTFSQELAQFAYGYLLANGLLVDELAAGGRQ